jgi:hypothetical protein
VAGHPSSPLAAVQHDVMVEYRLFRLQAADAGVNACEGQPHPSAADWVLLAGEAGALLHSTMNDHYAAVRLELWPAVPPHLDDARSDSAQGDMHLNTATLLIDSTTGWPNPATLALPVPGDYGIRARRRRTPRADEVDQEGSFEHGLEEWLIQIWPKT